MDRPPPERRAQLNALKLSALVRDAARSEVAITPSAFPGGAALRAGDAAWVLLDEQPARGLGGALAWASRAACTTLDLVAESATGLLARRAEAFTLEVRVWHLDGRVLVPAAAEPLSPPVDPHPDHLALADLVERGGAVVRVEHGVVSGEVDGLEVCRVVQDDSTAGPRLEVGVGTHDREAFALLHGDIPAVEALSGVVEAVRTHRRPHADPHPLNRLAAERALRERALESPATIGAAHLHAAEPPVPRSNVKDPVPCAAVGSTIDGRALLAVFSTGADLDVVPFAADARRFHMARLGEDLETMIVVPERDRFAVTVMLAEMLADPAKVVAWPE